MSKTENILTFGMILKNLRKEKNLPLRKVSAGIDIDQTLLSKIENGHRVASKELISKIAGFFNTDENKLLIHWLSDKIYYEIADEDIALKALQVAEEKVKYKISNK